MHTATLYRPDNGSSFRAPRGAEAFDSGNPVLCQAFEATFDQPDVYDYYCSPHYGEGMVGPIVGGNDANPEQPGLSAPTDVPSGAVRRVRQMNSQARSLLCIDSGTGGGEGGLPGGDDDDGESEADDDSPSTDDSSDGSFGWPFDVFF